ncbi:MAG: glutamate synthase large chain, partial [Mycobacteriales bacterium]
MTGAAVTPSTPSVCPPSGAQPGVPFSAVPPAQGLYDPGQEHDACGVAFVVDVQGRRSHSIVQQALTALSNLDHRGAAGREPSSGDGAGMLLQVPDGFLRSIVDFPLPAPDPVTGAGRYAVGLAFLPTNDDTAADAVALVERLAAEEGLTVLGWREVPVDPADLGPTALSVMPRMRQLFVAAGPATVGHVAGPATVGHAASAAGTAGAGSNGWVGEISWESGLPLERRAYCLRRRAERAARDAGLPLYFPSLSSRTLVYKGMLTTAQLGTFFPDLRDPRVVTALALVHSRFSTNTFPSWPLAHPYRLIAHNGEINTIRGNRNWMRAREALLGTDLFGPGGVERLLPICTEGVSDSASFDEVLELLHLGGRSLPHAVLMMIPEAWENHDEMDPARRAFYQFHGGVMEPWDGPAAVTFTDGTLIGAVLDRNGLRPARWWRTADDLVVLASETGVLDLDPARVVAKGRLQPGRMFLVDTAARRVVTDDEIKGALAAQHPYADWLHAGLI